MKDHPFLRKTLIFVIVFNLLCTCNTVHGYTSLGDPYEILDVPRTATALEIRKAYKAKAVVWHPDKNKGPEAEEQFVKINKAYELLSDPARRRLFDQRGITEDSLNLNPKPDYTSFNRFDPIDEILTFTTGGAFHYPFADGIAFLHKQSVTAKTFEQTTIPNSFHTPQLILFYGDWCSGCTRVAASWRSISDQLTNIGMEVSCVHADRETTVARKIGIKVIPSVVLMLDAHPYHYRESVIAANKVIAFIRSKLPYDLLVPLDRETLGDFLGSWWDNRIRVIIVGTSEAVRLRYQVLAFHFRERAAFGYTTTEQADFEVFRDRFGAPDGLDSIFVFKELGKPVASLSMTEIPQKLMKDLIENNKFLILPRLSSQGIMDAVCPTESSVYRRRLCVVFITRQTKLVEDRDVLGALREYAVRQSGSNRVRFAYLYGDRQLDFFTSLAATSKDSNIVIIWRQTANKMSYEWIDGGWDGTNTSILRLDNVLHRLMSEKAVLSYVVDVKELNDEHAQGFLFKLLKKVSLTMEFVRAQVTREMVIQTGSVIVAVLFIVAGGFLMAYLVRLEEESILAKAKADAQRSPASSNRTNHQPSATPGSPAPLHLLTQNPECRIHEMRGETYNGLVRLIKPGCRTVLLLVDTETKEVLLRKFQRCVWPYRKNKSLQFGFMHVDRLGGLSWYKQLLQLSLSEPKTLNINPRNCVGTVLSLNGHRKYFCVFHATMPATNRRRASSGYRNGAFLGFDSENSSDEQSDIERGGVSTRGSGDGTNEGAGILFTNHLLDNLSNWLDRLFEGSTHRYHINYWPDFPFK